MIALAQQDGVTQRQTAEDFGVSKSALATWLQKAELHERGLVAGSPGGKADDAAALREATQTDPPARAGGRGDAARRGVSLVSTTPKMIYPLARDLAAKGAPFRVPVVVACRVLGFSKQGYYKKQSYYKWVANPVSDRDWDEAHMINAAFDAHVDDPTFGFRLICRWFCQEGVLRLRP